MFFTEGNVSLFLHLIPPPLPPPLQTKADHADNAEVEIARCTRGQYFGELALVTNKPRAASAYAVGAMKCLGKTDAPEPDCS